MHAQTALLVAAATARLEQVERVEPGVHERLLQAGRRALTAVRGVQVLAHDRRHPLSHRSIP
jgi:hypothetical protein